MSDEALLENLYRRLPEDFSRKMLDGALKALGEADDPWAHISSPQQCAS
jgi:hypothetical protein